MRQGENNWNPLENRANPGKMRGNWQGEKTFPGNFDVTVIRFIPFFEERLFFLGRSINEEQNLEFLTSEAGWLGSMNSERFDRPGFFRGSKYRSLVGLQGKRGLYL